jgi:hypothetical protein
VSRGVFVRVAASSLLLVAVVVTGCDRGKGGDQSGDKGERSGASTTSTGGGGTAGASASPAASGSA